MPPIFELFPHLEARVKENMLMHLDFFTVEMLRSELATKMSPTLIEEIQSDKETESLGYKYLQNCIDKCPSYSIVLRWIHFLNFNYSTKSKSYMVDGHEHPEQ